MIKNHLILLIEDDQPIVNVLKHRLEQEHLDLMVAGDGEEGLRLALEFHPSLILLDILLPKMNGLEILKELHQDKWGKRAKVIILTNLSDAKSKIEAINYKVTDYITKTGCSLNNLIKKIKNNL